jgi:regulator of RNase E activity RraA
MDVLEALAVVVDGRVRDVGEISTLRMPVWAKATSAVGAGLAAQAHRVNTPVTIGDVKVYPVGIP